MDATFPTEAIILDRSYFREYDSRVVAYSREFGKLDLVVRGTMRAKSKLAGHVEPISKVSIMLVKGKQYDYVGSARVIDAYAKLKDDFDQLAFAGKAIKIYKKLIESNEPDADLYSLLCDYLQAANRMSAENESGFMLYFIFIYKFIAHLGYEPQLSGCTKCGKADNKNNNFNYRVGGLICPSCAKNEKNNLLISPKTVDILQHISNIQLLDYRHEAIDKVTMEEIKKILEFYVKYNLDFEI